MVRRLTNRLTRRDLCRHQVFLAGSSVQSSSVRSRVGNRPPHAAALLLTVEDPRFSQRRHQYLLVPNRHGPSRRRTLVTVLGQGSTGTTPCADFGVDRFIYAFGTATTPSSCDVRFPNEIYMATRFFSTGNAFPAFNRAAIRERCNAALKSAHLSGYRTGYFGKGRCWIATASSTTQPLHVHRARGGERR